MRDIEFCDGKNPTPVRDWHPSKCGRSKALNNEMTKLLCQDGKKKATHATKAVLRDLIQQILPNCNLSYRKTWALLARAGGLCAAGDKSGEHYVDAQRKFGKLGKGEESDEEENDSGI